MRPYAGRQTFFSVRAEGLSHTLLGAESTEEWLKVRFSVAHFERSFRLGTKEEFGCRELGYNV